MRGTHAVNYMNYSYFHNNNVQKRKKKRLSRLFRSLVLTAAGFFVLNVEEG